MYGKRLTEREMDSEIQSPRNLNSKAAKISDRKRENEKERRVRWKKRDTPGEIIIASLR